jgi:hypothetical protein
MPRQAERTKPTTFDSFTDVRITSSSSLESDSRNGTSLFTSEDDLDDNTRDRLGLLRRNQEVDHKGTTTITSAGGGMKHGKPFTSLSNNSSSSLPIDGVINANHDQLQQNAEILAAQDENLDKLSANLGRLQNITAEITSEISTQEFVIQEVSSIAERAENAVNDLTRQVDGIVKRYNAEAWIPRVIWGLLCILLVELIYLIYF